MRKTIWKGIVACLLLLAAATLAGCGSKKAADISGTYSATFNMKETLNRGLSESGMTLESDVYAEFILNLTADRKFSCDIDGAGFSKAFADVLTNDGPSIIDNMLKSEGVSEDMHETIAAASGYDSYDAFVSDMVQSVVSEMGEEFVGDLESQLRYEGTYKIDGSTLILNGEVNAEKGMEQATINEDGSISVKAGMDDGTVLDLTFVKE